jgi:hypothetical protein
MSHVELTVPELALAYPLPAGRLIDYKAQANKSLLVDEVHGKRLPFFRFARQHQVALHAQDGNITL